MAFSTKKYDADVPEGHAFQEHRMFHPTDMDLRRNGFRIHARPRWQEPLWWRGGRVWTQSEALASLSKVD
jgi:hypothetical protein